MISVLLDTNAYLRLAKRIRPMLGVSFDEKDYVLTVLKDVEDEVHRNPDLTVQVPLVRRANARHRATRCTVAAFKARKSPDRRSNKHSEAIGNFGSVAIHEQVGLPTKQGRLPRSGPWICAGRAGMDTSCSSGSVLQIDSR